LVFFFFAYILNGKVSGNLTCTIALALF